MLPALEGGCPRSENIENFALRHERVVVEKHESSRVMGVWIAGRCDREHEICCRHSKVASNFRPP